MSSLSGAVLAGLLLVALTTPVITAEEVEWPPFFDSAREVARSEAALELGIVFEAAQVEAETLIAGERIALFKISGAQSMVEIGVDEFLNRVDLEAMREATRLAALSIEAKLSPELDAKIAEQPGEIFPVLIWLSEGPYEDFERPDPQAPYDPDYLDIIDAELVEHVRQHTEPIVEAAKIELGGLGLEADGSSNAPLVWTEASGDQILEIIYWPSVARIEQDREVETELASAAQAVSAPSAHSRMILGLPLTGLGRVAIVEPEASPWTPHPNLRSASNPIQIIRESSRCNLNDDHPTLVMGVIRSSHATDRGMAPSARGVAGASCTKKFSSIIKTTDLVVDAGNWIVNLSWSGGPSNRKMGLLDRYYDLVAHRRWRNFTAAAGNGADLIFYPQLQNLKSPAMAYNTLAVGALDDHNSSDPNDDSVWSSSSWRNPISARGDRIKPNVMAPGVNIRTTSIQAANWLTHSGTSMAAPVVASQVGLLLQRQFGLHFGPEISRAIVMASAHRNLDGGPWSTKDGAGSVNLASADDVAARQKGDWGMNFFSCGPFEERILTSMTIQKDKRFRAALAWSADASFPGNTLWEIQPGSDVDLYLTDLAGNILARSTSWDNTHEVLEFVSPFTLGVQLRARKPPNCTVDPGRVGWAFWQEG